jgi:glutamate formiminotransferase
MKFSLELTIQILNNTPQVLSSLFAGLPDELTHSNEGGDTWCPFDILGHLVHGEKRDWITRVKKIIAIDNDKKFEPVDRFAQFDEREGKTVSGLLEEFSTLRKSNIEKLKSFNINNDMLKKTGSHPEFGTVTLQQLLATWTAHDLAHISQITRVLAKQHKEEMGPWVTYFNLLK